MPGKMKATNQQLLLETLEKKVELHIQQAVSVYQNLREEELLGPAADGGWSIAQCLAHLNSYGEYYLPRIKAGLESQEGMPASSTYRSSWLGSLFTRMMDPATDNKKYKAIKKHMPPLELDANAVVAEFLRQQEELLLYIRSSRNADLGSIQIPISILKWIHLKLGDVLQFLIAHNHRHLQQANRNIPMPANRMQDHVAPGLIAC